MKTNTVSRTEIRRQITAKLLDRLERDERVHIVLAAGSTALGSENELSDTDLCVVMKDDDGLKQIMGEINVILNEAGNLSGYYTYTPYHFYAVYDGSVPLDIYLVSASLYYILKGSVKVMVDHRGGRSVKDLPLREKDLAMAKDLIFRANVRNFRLLSKIQKSDYMPLISIMDAIRSEQIIPLLRIVYGADIDNAKTMKLDCLDGELRNLFVDSYPCPEKGSCLKAVRSMAEIIRRIALEVSKIADLGDLLEEVEKNCEYAKGFK